jgi:acyl carrier protein
MSWPALLAGNFQPGDNNMSTVMMNSGDINDRVNAIFQRLFQAAPEALGDTVRRGQLERWDSLGHLELLTALEKEFQIDIPAEEVLSMETVGDVKRLVAKLHRP